LKWKESEAHSAVYDAEQTAKLFCRIINTWDEHFSPLDTPASETV
jgi:ribonuclease T